MANVVCHDSPTPAPHPDFQIAHRHTCMQLTSAAQHHLPLYPIQHLASSTPGASDLRAVAHLNWSFELGSRQPSADLQLHIPDTLQTCCYDLPIPPLSLSKNAIVTHLNIQVHPQSVPSLSTIRGSSSHILTSC